MNHRIIILLSFIAILPMVSCRTTYVGKHLTLRQQVDLLENHVENQDKLLNFYESKVRELDWMEICYNPVVARDAHERLKKQVDSLIDNLRVQQRGPFGAIYWYSSGKVFQILKSPIFMTGSDTDTVFRAGRDRSFVYPPEQWTFGPVNLKNDLTGIKSAPKKKIHKKAKSKKRVLYEIGIQDQHQ